MIDSVYRSDRKNNIIEGGSLGGLFALYALFHEPTLFNRYIICSPSLQWDDEITFKYEKAFAEKNHTLNAKVFISSSEIEEEIFPASNFKKFIEQFKGSKYQELELESLVVDNISHSSGQFYEIGRGLQFVFSKPDIKVNTSLLDQYVGHYEQDWVITRKGNSLYVNLFGGNAKLYAETPENFYMKGGSFLCQFKKDNKGKVTGINLDFFGNNRVFIKKLH